MKSFISILCLLLVIANGYANTEPVPPPSAPTATAATAIGSMYFNANWTSVSGATSYYIDVSTSNTFSSFVSGFNNRLVSSISGAGTTYATITGGISAGNTYYYRLRAANASGSSVNSNVISVTIAPGTPVALQETNVTATTFQANWNAVTGATSYAVQYSLSNTFGTIYNTQNTSGTSASGLTFATGTIYYYRVMAGNAGGQSTWSSVITAGTTPAIPVATAGNTITSTSFKANWNAAAGATGYAIDVSTTNTFSTFVAGYNNTTVSTIAGYTSTSVPITLNLTPGSPFYYRLRALGANGPSANSNTITVWTVPGAPVATAATNVQAVQFVANWNSVPAANNYRIDVSALPTFSSFVLNNQNVPTGTSYTVTGLTEGQTYYYRVRAENNSGASANSNTISCTPALAAPVATASTNVISNSFYVNWNPSPGATGYYFDVSTASDFSTYVYQNLSTSSYAGFTGNPNGSIIVYSNINPVVNTYYYRIRAVNANGTSAHSNVITVWRLPVPPVATLPSGVSGSGFTANWNAEPTASEYQLDVATDLNFTNLLSGYNNLVVTGTSTTLFGLPQGNVYYYRVRAKNSSGTSGNSNVIRAVTLTNYNYVRSITATKPGLLTHTDFTSAPSAAKTVSTNYIDGMGRTIQTVMKENSPAQKDLVQPISYDAYNRQSREYLPYASVENHGNVYRNALGVSDYEHSDQYLFYQGTYGVAADSRPFRETEFESSVFSRSKKTYGPGSDWGPTAQNKFTGHSYFNNEHGTTASNTLEKLIAWDISGGLPVRKAALTNYVETGGYFSSQQLSITQTTDERGNSVREYKNRSGRVILKKVQAGSSTANLNSTTDWALTYYIYDIFGNLRFVLSPELSRKIHDAADTYAVTQTDLDNWAFQYRYDALRRMSEKQIPGAGPVYLVYDKRDRIVLSQDANQRTGATNAIKYWTFIKYDQLNRPILTGIKDTTTSVQLTQVQMQQAMDIFYGKSWTRLGETYIGSAANNVHGYTNKSYPVVTSAATLDANRYLTVTYYDTYSFKSLWTGSYSYVDENLSRTVNGITYSQPDTEFLSVKGLVTGIKVKVLDGGVTGGSSWLKTVSYYDDDYRQVQTISDNYKQGSDRTTNLFDFIGNVLQTKSAQDEYDIAWRDMTPGVAKSGERLYRNAGGSDNNEGAASDAILAASTDGWFEFTHSNANNLYIGLSTANTGTAYSTINYCLQVGGSTCSAIQPGQSNVNLGAHALGDVFRIERFSGTVRIRKNGTLIHSFAGTSTSALLVDVSFVSGQSSVLFARSSFSASSHVIVRTFDYDHAGRVINTWHKLDSGPDILLSKNEYNELGQRIDKKLHSTVSTGNDSRQSVDYRYNIRGWLTKINDAALSDTGESRHDLFGFEVGYNEDIGISNTALYNGNISGTKWSTNLGLGTTSQNGYAYTYDALNRILSSTFKEKVSGSWSALGDSRNAESGFDYDLNGNIKALTRNDNRTSGLKMDVLVYDYGAGSAQSNKLLKVTDNGDDYKGFMDGTNGGNDYNYDANGNMTLDYNKGISTAITYNYLNLPEVITRGGATNSIRYMYDATGRKLAQYVTLTGTPKQTDYAGEYVYENDALQMIGHEEGRIVLAKEEKVFMFDGSHQSGITTTANVSLTNETQGEEIYLKVTAAAGTALTKRGVTPIGGTFTVVAGEKYAFRVKGYRSGETVNLYVKGNGSDLLWPAAQLTPGTGHKNDVWVETFFTIPAGITTIELGALWNSSATTTQFFYINELELVKLGTQAPEYQYHFKDHLGNVRMTFTSKQDVKTSAATLETANAGAESGEFIYYNEAVKINATLFDHTNAGATNYAARLTGSANERYGLAKSLSVMPGDTVRATVYAKYLDTNSSNWTTPLANLITAIANGTAPAGTFVDGGLTGSTGGATPSFASLLSKGSETGTAPKAYLNYIVFDRNFVFKDGGFIRMTTAAREYGQDGAHETLFKEIIVKEPGYVYVFLSNDTYALGGPMTEVYFDDFSVQHAKSPVVQTNDYYAFGMNFNSYQRENATGNEYLYNSKELQDELDLGWFDYEARQYDPMIGRFLSEDPMADISRRWSPYAYAYDNPIRFTDPDGMVSQDEVDEEEEKKKHEIVSRTYNKDGSVTITEKYTATKSTTTTKTNEDGTSTETTEYSQTTTTTSSTINDDGEITKTETETVQESGKIEVTKDQDGKSTGVNIKPNKTLIDHQQVRGTEALEAQGIIATEGGVGGYQYHLTGTEDVLYFTNLFLNPQDDPGGKRVIDALVAEYEEMKIDRAKAFIKQQQQKADSAGNIKQAPVLK